MKPGPKIIAVEATLTWVDKRLSDLLWISFGRLEGGLETSSALMLLSPREAFCLGGAVHHSRGSCHEKMGLRLGMPRPWPKTDEILGAASSLPSQIEGERTASTVGQKIDIPMAWVSRGKGTVVGACFGSAVVRYLGEKPGEKG